MPASGAIWIKPLNGPIIPSPAGTGRAGDHTTEASSTPGANGGPIFVGTSSDWQEIPFIPSLFGPQPYLFLNAYPGEDTFQAIKLALMDDEALIRRTALESIAPTNQKVYTELIATLAL